MTVENLLDFLTGFCRHGESSLYEVKRWTLVTGKFYFIYAIFREIAQTVDLLVIFHDLRNFRGFLRFLAVLRFAHIAF